MVLFPEKYMQKFPKVEYSLTELGKSLQPILNAMLQWGTEYKEKSYEND